MVQNFDVFVSYSSKDKAIADAVVAAVEGVGIRCWYAPRDIVSGADWADLITKAIHDCSIMVLISSKEDNRSQRVIDEVNYTIDQGKPLLPNYVGWIGDADINPSHTAFKLSGWGSNFSDEENWVGTVLACDGKMSREVVTRPMSLSFKPERKSELLT